MILALFLGLEMGQVVPEEPPMMDDPLTLLTVIAVIGLSAVARIASAGTVIVLQKDWIVVISGDSADHLASECF